MEYLGIQPKKPRVAVFDFTSCEGCQLQLANGEDTLIEFLDAIDIVNFREISSTRGSEYDIAMIEGAITRSDEIDRLLRIRDNAKTLVALGTCACFGGVNKLKNAFELKDTNEEVYGDTPKETLPARAVHDIVKVDLKIPGCPVSKREVERIIQHVIWDVPYVPTAYPVCHECKQRYTVCICDIDAPRASEKGKGQICLGPITHGGCQAPCPAGGAGCWGCRGPAEDANLDSFFSILKERGFEEWEIGERIGFFGAFEELLCK